MQRLFYIQESLGYKNELYCLPQASVAHSVSLEHFNHPVFTVGWKFNIQKSGQTDLWRCNIQNMNSERNSAKVVHSHVGINSFGICVCVSERAVFNR